MTSKGVASERVSAAFGVWSVVAAVGSSLVAYAVVGIWLTVATTGNSDPRWSAAVAVSNHVGSAIAWAVAAFSAVLGVISIRRAKPRAGQRGRSKAIALGWVGIGIAVLLGPLYIVGLTGAT